MLRVCTNQAPAVRSGLLLGASAEAGQLSVGLGSHQKGAAWELGVSRMESSAAGIPCCIGTNPTPIYPALLLCGGPLAQGGESPGAI